MIAAADIKFRLTGGASNVSPTASLGGAVSTVAGGIVPQTKTLNSEFDDISGDEAYAGDIEYRCFTFKNEHATLTAIGGKLFVNQDSTSANTAMSIGLDPVGKNGTATTIATENDAPSGVTFSAPTSKATGLTVPDLAPSDYINVWVKRVVTAGMSAIDDDNWILELDIDSAA
jgi:hypothetical protein